VNVGGIEPLDSEPAAGSPSLRGDHWTERRDRGELVAMNASAPRDFTAATTIDSARTHLYDPAVSIKLTPRSSALVTMLAALRSGFLRSVGELL
jgi:hypothetical protein